MDIFCEIIKDESNNLHLFEDEEIIIINSKYPVAEKHFLVIPKRHIESIVAIEAGDEQLIGKMCLAAKNFAATNGITDFKLTFNAGKYLEIHHLHLHILCGEMKNS